MTIAWTGFLALAALAPPPHDEHLERLDLRVAEIVAARPEGAPAVAALLSREFATQLGVRDPYAAATFSFEFETRDDVQLARNDWDIQYGNGNDSLSVQMVVDDRSRIFDLGAADFATAPLPDAGATIGGEKPLDAVKDHVYVVHTVDADTDLWSRFRILEIEKKKWIVFEWERFDSTLPELRRLERMALPDLGSGAIRLEVRSASGGGNPHGVFLDGTATTSVDSIGRTPAPPLELAPAQQKAHRDSTAFCDGGLVPEGHVFVVESIEWTATLEAGGKGPLSFEFWLGPYRVAIRDEDDGEGRRHTIDGGARSESGPSSMGKFTGTVVIRPGEETRVAAIARHGTIARATVTGRLVSARGNRLPPLPIDLGKRDARELNDFLRRVDEGEFDERESGLGSGENAELRAAFLEAALRFRTSDEDRGRLERAVKLLRKP